MAYRFRHSAALLCAALSLQSCASTQLLNDARDQFYQGKPEAAIKILDSEPASSRNQLLVLLDKGLIAHTAGLYRESSRAFIQATRLLASQTTISVSEQSTTLVTNDRTSTYKGEVSERLWIHSFQMMNFLMLNEAQGAAVEARQAIALYNKHIDVLKIDYFTRALIALSLEAVGNYDGALIEYKKLFADSNESTVVAAVALTLAESLGRENDAKRFKQALLGTQLPVSTGPNHGELIVFVQTGAIQPKEAGDLAISHDMLASFPVYSNTFKQAVKVDATAQGHAINPLAINVQLVDVSRRALSDRGKKIAAKQILRLAAKKALIDTARKEGEAWGALVGVLMVASEQADTRSWETLPAHFSLLRLQLPEGINDVQITVHDNQQSHNVTLHNVNIQAKQRIYRTFRLGAGTPILQAVPLLPDSTLPTSAEEQSPTPNTEQTAPSKPAQKPAQAELHKPDMTPS